MGLSGKSQVVDGIGVESEGKKWVIAGIPLRAPLKRIYTHEVAPAEAEAGNVDPTDEDVEEFSTTPTSEESRIPVKLTCPAAPRKRKPSLKCNYGDIVREFFTPPDLECVFIRHVERAS